MSGAEKAGVSLREGLESALESGDSGDSGAPLNDSELNHAAQELAGAEELELRAEERRLSRAPWYEPIAHLPPVSEAAKAGARLEFREAIAQAFEGIGGVASLIEWARRNPGVFYTKVWSPLSRSVLVAGRMGPDGAGGHQFTLALAVDNDAPPTPDDERRGAVALLELEKKAAAG
jgi:hypothetical protein